MIIISKYIFMLILGIFNNNKLYINTIIVEVILKYNNFNIISKGMFLNFSIKYFAKP